MFPFSHFLRSGSYHIWVILIFTFPIDPMTKYKIHNSLSMSFQKRKINNESLITVVRRKKDLPLLPKNGQTYRFFDRDWSIWNTSNSLLIFRKIHDTWYHLHFLIALSSIRQRVIDSSPLTHSFHLLQMYMVGYRTWISTGLLIIFLIHTDFELTPNVSVHKSAFCI